MCSVRLTRPARRRFIASMVVACAMAQATIADAQDPGEARDTATARDTSVAALAPVVVTATRTEQPLLDTPASVTLVSADLIAARGAPTVAEALQGVTGLNVQYYSEGNFPTLRLRGSGETGVVSNTDFLVLVDGVPQVNGNSQANLDQVPFEQVERIEVVRGPASALYGRNAISGTINIITAQPPDAHEVRAHTTLGSFGLLRPRLTLGTPLGETVGLLLSGSYERYSGWRERTDRRAADVFGKLSWSLRGGTRISAILQYFDADQRVATQLPMRPDGSLLPVRRKENFNLPDSNTQNSSLHLTATLDQPLTSEARLAITTYYRDTDRLLAADASFIDEIDEANGVLIRYPFEPSSTETVIGIEPRVVADLPLGELPVTLTAGAMFEQNSGTDRAVLILTDGSDEFGGLPVNYLTGDQVLANLRRADPMRDNEFESESLAGYIQTQLDLTDRAHLTAGVRFDTYRRSLTNLLTQAPRVSSRFSRFTPKVALNYRWSEEVSTYLSYSEGFNPPFGLARDFEREGAEDLRPEKATNYEGGAKALIGRALLLSGAAYHMERRDLVRTVRDVGVTRQLNAGGLDITGIELEARIDLAELIPGVSGYGNYSYTSTEWKDYVLDDTDFAGQRMIGVPRHLASAGLDWRSPTDTFRGGVWADHVGSWDINRENTVRNQPYTVWNARLGGRPPFLPGFQIEVRLLNLFDREYLSRTEIGFGGDPIAGTPGRPRSVAVSLTHTF